MTCHLKPRCGLSKSDSFVYVQVILHKTSYDYCTGDHSWHQPDCTKSLGVISFRLLCFLCCPDWFYLSLTILLCFVPSHSFCLFPRPLCSAPVFCQLIRPCVFKSLSLPLSHCWSVCCQLQVFSPKSVVCSVVGVCVFLFLFFLLLPVVGFFSCSGFLLCYQFFSLLTCVLCLHLGSHFAKKNLQQ